MSHTASAGAAPKGLGIVSALPSLYANGFLGYLLESQRQCGDIFEVPMGTVKVTCYAHPEHVYHVSIKNKEIYSKDCEVFRRLRPLLGFGIFTSEGELWRQQRPIIQPDFTKKGVGFMLDQMATITDNVRAEWQRQIALNGGSAVINITNAMRDVAMRFICQLVLGIDVTKRAEQLGDEIDRVAKVIISQLAVPKSLSDKLPLLTDPWVNRRLRELDEFIFEIIAAERGSNSVVSRLKTFRNEATGEELSIRQLRDEVMSLFVAGHETTANAMGWNLSLLAAHPQFQEKMHAELDAVLAGKQMNSENMDKLDYTQAVAKETLRLYPIAPFTPRRLIADDYLDGYKIKAGTEIMLCIYNVQRHSSFWADPHRFDPNRFVSTAPEPGHRYAYVPFGAGPHTCIGNHFAMAEMQMVLSTLGQHFWFAPEGKPNLQPTAVPSTLRPATPIQLRIFPRCPSTASSQHDAKKVIEGVQPRKKVAEATPL